MSIVRIEAAKIGKIACRPSEIAGYLRNHDLIVIEEGGKPFSTMIPWQAVEFLGGIRDKHNTPAQIFKDAADLSERLMAHSRVRLFVARATTGMDLSRQISEIRAEGGELVSFTFRFLNSAMGAVTPFESIHKLAGRPIYQEAEEVLLECIESLLQTERNLDERRSIPLRRIEHRINPAYA